MNQTTGQGALALLAVLGAAEPASAYGEPAIGGQIGLVSEYVARGVRQSWGKPALQGGIEASHGALSAGIWASSIDGRFVDGGQAEIDLYAQLARQAGAAVLSAGLYYYAYPGASGYDYGELMFGAAWGSLQAKLYVTATDSFFGIGGARGSLYADLGKEFRPAEAWTVRLHGGAGQLAGRGNGVWDWRDLRVELVRELSPRWRLSGAWTRAWGRDGRYARFQSATLDRAGRALTMDAGAGTFVLGASRAF